MSESSCAHPACSCTVGPDEKVCAPSCLVDAEEPIEDAHGCSCGHSECLGVAGEAGGQALRRGADEASHAPEAPRPAH